MTRPNSESTNKAVIYCRSATTTSGVTRDNAKDYIPLSKQAAIGREFARSQGYDVTATFNDIISGNTRDRPGFNQLLEHLRISGQYSIIIADHSRLARSLDIYHELKTWLAAIGGVVQIAEAHQELPEWMVKHAAN